MQLPKLNWSYADFEDYILSTEAYEYDRTYYIDNRGKDVKIISDHYTEYFAKVQIKLAEQSDTLKVEGIERFTDWSDGTIHAFRYWEGSPSFGEHTDPVDVVLQVQDGAKLIEINGFEKYLQKDDIWWIPANTPHKALNIVEGLMFSYGMYDTEQH